MVQENPIPLLKMLKEGTQIILILDPIVQMTVIWPNSSPVFISLHNDIRNSILNVIMADLKVKQGTTLGVILRYHSPYIFIVFEIKVYPYSCTDQLDCWLACSHDQ